MAVKTKQDAARVLADVAGDRRFFCRDGCISQNLTRMVACLNHMTEETFGHHVTPWKNDFSNWVRDVLGDDELANDLAGASAPSEAAKAIKHRMAWLRKRLK